MTSLKLNLAIKINTIDRLIDKSSQSTIMKSFEINQRKSSRHGDGCLGGAKRVIPHHRAPPL